MKLVPDIKLVYAFSLGVLPFILTASLIEQHAFTSLCIASIIPLVTLLDAFKLVSHTFELNIKWPSKARIIMGRLQSISIEIIHKNIGSIHMGFSLPRYLHAEPQKQWIEFTPDSERSVINWSFKAERRGKYALDRIYLERRSTWGFWSQYISLPLHAELQVVPKLLPSSNMSFLLFKQTGFGWRQHRLRGSGKEFDQLREYTPSDSYQDIDWKATARRQNPVTRTYQMERTQDVIVIIDTSRLTNRELPQTEKSLFAGDTLLEAEIQCSLAIARSAEQHGDRFGLGVFSRHVKSFVATGTGKEHFSCVQDQLHNLQSDTYSPNFGELMTQLSTSLRKRALIFILTCLDDSLLAESFVQSVELIRKRHLVVAASILPDDISPVFSKGQIKESQQISEKLAQHDKDSALNHLDYNLTQIGVTLVRSQASNMMFQIVQQYLQIKSKQLL